MNMDLFNCYNNLDEKTRKRLLNIEAIGYKRRKALENKIRVAIAAKENNDMKTFCEVMCIDTKYVLDKVRQGLDEVLDNE